MNIKTSKILSTKLEIIIITYNRSQFLMNTLDYLRDSAFSFCKITILDNCSTDNTIEIVMNEVKMFSNLNIISNKINIGLGANIMRAIGLSNSLYTWVLCDDDNFDFSDVDDVINVIIDEKADLIHMGAHEYKEWTPSGVLMTPTELIDKGYNYFLYGSFLPCNLFKTTSVYPTIIQAYDNISNMYPHMPLIFDFFLNEKLIYVSKTRIVKASTSGQSYNYNKWLEAWVNT